MEGALRELKETKNFWDNEKVQLSALLFFALAVFLAKLGANGMANYDDCYYAQEAKEILQTGQWSVLHFDGKISFQNTPFFMWMEALAYKVFGVSVFAAKLPSALMSFSTVVLTYFLGRELFGHRRALFSGFILASTYPFFKYGRHAMLDVTQSFFVALSLGALWWSVKKDRRFFWVWGLGVALALLTKSAFGFFPVIMTLLFLVFSGRWKWLWNPHFLGGTALFLGTAAAWVWVQYSAGGPEFIKTHVQFIILSKMAGGAPEAWWAHFGFFKDLATYYWPWLPFSVYGLILLFRGDLKNRDLSLFLGLWSLTVLAVMSFMKTRFIWYLMQSFPALALVSAHGVFRVLGDEKSSQRASRILVVLCLFIGVLLFALPIPLDRNREKDVRTLSPTVKYFAEKGFRVVALREDYYGLNNALLFFSDHSAQAFYRKPADLAGEFASKNPVLCLAHQADLPELRDSLRGWFFAQNGGDLVLISNRKLNLTGIPQRGPYE